MISDLAHPSDAAPKQNRLTRPENIVLTFVYYLQPATAYRVRRAFSESITGRLGASAGAVYAIIRRLVAAGLLQSEAVKDNARGAELLTITQAGQRALRNWVGRVENDDLVLEDPVRTKMLAIDVLDHAEAVAWFEQLVRSLEAKVAELEAFGRANADMPRQFDLHDNARSVLITRLEWARRVLRRWGDVDQSNAKADSATSGDT